jgi:hypothetical protein
MYLRKHKNRINYQLKLMSISLSKQKKRGTTSMQNERLKYLTHFEMK